jgi:hypothetical protein
MRTTVVLEPELAERLREHSEKERISFKKAVNEALKAGLETLESRKPGKPFRVEPHSFKFKPGVDPNKLNQLAGQLEDQEIVKKLGL